MKNTLTISSYCLLKKLKRIKQPIITEICKNENLIFITQSTNFKTQKDDFFVIPYEYKVVDNKKQIKKFKLDTYTHLIENNFIETQNNQIFIKHQGLHIEEIIGIKISQFLFNSFLIPTIVAIITTYLYNTYLR